MKESKKYFENNRLNKGFKKIPSHKQSDMSVIRNQFKHILPPVDIMEEFEELSPGTFEKLLDMAKREQNHRHSLDLIVQEKYNRATTMGRYFSLVLMLMICITTLILAFVGKAMVASIFAACAFACIFMVSFLYSKTAITKIVDSSKKRGNRPPHRSENRSGRRR